MTDKYFKILFCVIIVLLFFGLNGCKSSYSSYRELGRYYDEENEFSIKFPDEWKIDETEDLEGLTVTAIRPSENEEELWAESIMIDVRYLMNKPSLEKWMEELDSASKSRFHPYNVKEIGDVTIGSCKGKFIVFTYRQSGEDWLNMSFIMVDGRMGYLISCHTAPSKFAEYRRIFEETAKSFRFES